MQQAGQGASAPLGRVLWQKSKDCQYSVKASLFLCFYVKYSYFKIVIKCILASDWKIYTDTLRKAF